MPNYVRNIVKMKGIADLPLYNERPGEKYFDFQKLIPMPAELEVEDGSRTEQRIIYFLTERCTIPVRDLDQRKSDLVRKLVSNDFAKMDWPEEVFNRTLNWMSGATDEERDNAYEGGRQYISNYETHGFTTWYGWCRHNWGTKWNACETQIIDSDTIVFDTAWSNPGPIIRKLGELYPDRRVEHWWADEDVGYNTGHRVVENGVEQVECYDGGLEGDKLYEKCWCLVD